MSPRTGRPIIGKRKDINVKVRFDEDLHKELTQYCEKKSITRTEAIRQGVQLLLSEDKKK